MSVAVPPDSLARSWRGRDWGRFAFGIVTALSVGGTLRLLRRALHDVWPDAWIINPLIAGPLVLIAMGWAAGRVWRPARPSWLMTAAGMFVMAAAWTGPLFPVLFAPWLREPHYSHYGRVIPQMLAFHWAVLVPLSGLLLLAGHRLARPGKREAGAG